MTSKNFTKKWDTLKRRNSEILSIILKINTLNALLRTAKMPNCFWTRWILRLSMKWWPWCITWTWPVRIK
jgi:hypothetical protein